MFWGIQIQVCASVIEKGCGCYLNSTLELKIWLSLESLMWFLCASSKRDVLIFPPPEEEWQPPSRILSADINIGKQYFPYDTGHSSSCVIALQKKNINTYKTPTCAFDLWFLYFVKRWVQYKPFSQNSVKTILCMLNFDLPGLR